MRTIIGKKGNTEIIVQYQQSLQLTDIIKLLRYWRYHAFFFVSLISFYLEYAAQV